MALVHVRNWLVLQRVAAPDLILQRVMKQKTVLLLVFEV